LSDFDNAKIIGLTGSLLAIMGIIGSLAGLSFFRLTFISGPGWSSGFMSPMHYPYPLAFYSTLSWLSLAGWVLIIISLYLFSRFYGEPGIFSYILYSILAIISGFILSIILFMVGVVTLVILIGLLIMILALLAFYAGIIAGGYFAYTSLRLLSMKSREESFKYAGILLLISAILVIILPLALLFNIASLTVLAVAYYSLKPPGIVTSGELKS